MRDDRLTRRAESDLVGIADYISADNPDAAQRVVEALHKTHKTFQLLSRNPKIGLGRSDLRPNLRVFPARRPANNYIVFYYPKPDHVIIAAVLHGSRDWPGMFSRGEI